ncbi:hypothetical protein SA9_10695 [Staphylococcus warneri]|nr:hypothetical protein SA9_10695 [Staphylococcus warneri]
MKGGVHMALTILSLVGTFILSVIAGVVANYITDNLKKINKKPHFALVGSGVFCIWRTILHLLFSV